jgi:hypothetical protein
LCIEELYKRQKKGSRSDYIHHGETSYNIREISTPPTIYGT